MTKTTPGNVHDSVAFFEVYNVLNEKFKDEIKNICLDAGYVTPAICREIILNDHTPLMPYKRPMTGKGLFKKTNMHMMNITIVIFVQITKYYLIQLLIKMVINNINPILIDV